MARTPNLVDADRANICPALQRLLRADGAAVGAADGAACVPDVADFPAVYTTVREPLDGARTSDEEGLARALAQSEAVLGALSALIDYRVSRLVLLNGLDLPGSLNPELANATSTVRDSNARLLDNAKKLGVAKGALERAEGERDQTRLLKPGVPDDATCEQSQALGDAEFSTACAKVNDAREAVATHESMQAIHELELDQAKAGLADLWARVATLSRLVDDLRGALHAAIDRTLSGHLARRARANQDLERAVEVLSAASGVVAP